MKIYLAHSSKFDYINELQAPIKASDLVQKYEFIFFPEKGGAHNFDSKDIIKGKKIDLIVADISRPSVGTGIELGWAEMLGIPMIIMCKAGSVYSSYLKGLSIGFFEYDSDEDMITKLGELLQAFSEGME